MKLSTPVFENATGEIQQVELPCNMMFDYTEMEGGILVSLSGFTAGPPATINSPQILVPFYNPAACFNGYSINGNIGYMIAFLDIQPSPVIKVHGWISSISDCMGKFNEVSLELPVKAKLANR